MTTAEGGTAGPATSHMVISARSKSPFGPWENSPHNPIIRTKDPAEQWWSVGHGTIFDDAHGKWWLVFHGYENGHQNMGRQTLLLSIEWTQDGWYKIPAGVKVDGPLKRPSGTAGKAAFSLSDDFAGKILKPHWKFYGPYDPGRFRLDNNSLVLKAKGNSVGDCSPLLCIPSDHSYLAQVELSIKVTPSAAWYSFTMNAPIRGF